MPNPDVESSVKPQPHQKRPFYHRFLLALGLSACLIGFSLGLGILGYHLIAGFNWVDSLPPEQSGIAPNSRVQSSKPF